MQQTYPAPVESSPGTLKAWAAIAIGGSLLTSLLGVFIIIAGAAIGSSADLQNQISGAVPGGFHITGGLIAGFGIGVFLFGLVWAAVNYFLYRSMSQRQQWAWIVALVLLGLGTLFDLAGHAGGSWVHLILIQVPLGVLLLLAPTRQWVGAGGGALAPAGGYGAPSQYGAPPPAPMAPPAPPAPSEPPPPPVAPSSGFAGAAPPPAPETAPPPAPASPDIPASESGQPPADAPGETPPENPPTA